MKNKKIQFFSLCLLIVFSVFLFMLNIPVMSKEQREQQEIEIMLKKEEETIKNIEFFNEITKIGNITNKNEFNEFRDYVNGTNGKSETTFLGYTINLMVDLDFAGENFVPIGTMVGTSVRKFMGRFDGNNHILSNITITSNSTDICGDIGVFGYLGSSGEWSGVVNLTVTINSFTLTNPGLSMGGLIGSTSGDISIFNCMVLPAKTDAIIAAINTDSCNVGGIIGYCNSYCISMSECANYVTLSNDCSSGTVTTGGIIAKYVNTDDRLRIRLCANKATSLFCGTSTTDYTYLGGILGYSEYDVTIEHCMNTASLYGGTCKQSNSSFVANVKSSNGDLYVKDNHKVEDINFYYDLNADEQEVSIYDNLYVAGICGYVNGDVRVNSCFSSFSGGKSSSAKTRSEYFFGRQGTDVKDNTTEDIVGSVGDYVYMRYSQTIKRYRNLSFYTGTLKTDGMNYVVNKFSNFKSEELVMYVEPCNGYWTMIKKDNSKNIVCLKEECCQNVKTILTGPSYGIYRGLNNKFYSKGYDLGYYAISGVDSKGQVLGTYYFTVDDYVNNKYYKTNFANNESKNGYTLTFDSYTAANFKKFTDFDHLPLYNNKIELVKDENNLSFKIQYKFNNYYAEKKNIWGAVEYKTGGPHTRDLAQGSLLTIGLECDDSSSCNEISKGNLERLYTGYWKLGSDNYPTLKCLYWEDSYEEPL